MPSRRRRRGLCCCCWDQEDDEDWSDASSESSGSGYESAEDVAWSPRSTSVPKYTTPKGAQEWDSLFFTPEMLAAVAPPSPPARQVQAELGSIERRGSSQFESLQMTKSLRVNVSAMAVEAPASTPTMLTPLKVSMVELRRAMRSEPFWYCRFLKKSRKCHDIKKYRWTSSESGLARGVRSMLPLPNDLPLPSWLARSLKVPEETAFTTVVRMTGAGADPESEDLGDGDEPVVLMMQSCSHDAPYGEYFRIQETLIFSKALKGVELKRWVSVLWVKSLPWALAALRGIIESQTLADSQKAHGDLVKCIVQAAEDAR